MSVALYFIQADTRLVLYIKTDFLLISSQISSSPLGGLPTAKCVRTSIYTYNKYMNVQYKYICTYRIGTKYYDTVHRNSVPVSAPEH
jgi:hypothetical protein